MAWPARGVLRTEGVVRKFRDTQLELTSTLGYSEDIPKCCNPYYSIAQNLTKVQPMLRAEPPPPRPAKSGAHHFVRTTVNPYIRVCLIGGWWRFMGTYKSGYK